MAVLDVDKVTFEPEVLQAEGTVFVDYYGDGCVPCAALRPFVDQYAEEYGDKIKFCSLNTTKKFLKSLMCLIVCIQITLEFSPVLICFFLCRTDDRIRFRCCF